MNDNLYFIPMIAEALQEPDPKFALRETFDRITDIGWQPGRSEGFRRYLRFMAEVVREHSRIGSVEESSVLADVATVCVKRLTATERGPDFARTPSAATRFPEQEAYQEFCAGIHDAARRPSLCEIFVERNGLRVGGFSLMQAADTHTIDDVTPGHYLLYLESGRVLWERVLGDHDLMCSKAFPGKPLPMAASTGDGFVEPTHSADLVGDRLVLRVYPGVETGSIALIWQGRETPA